MITRNTCKRCLGRGRVFTRTGGGPCPVCGGAGEKKGMARLQAINAAHYCWKAFTRGQTGMVNLEMALTACFREHISWEELVERIGISPTVIIPIASKYEADHAKPRLFE